MQLHMFTLSCCFCFPSSNRDPSIWSGPCSCSSKPYKDCLTKPLNYGQPETWDYNFLTPTATYLNSKLLSRKLNCHNVLFKLTMVLCVFLLFLYIFSVSYSSTQMIAASCGLAEKVSLNFIILKLMFITLMWHMCSLYVLMPRIEAPT